MTRRPIEEHDIRAYLAEITAAGRLAASGVALTPEIAAALRAQARSPVPAPEPARAAPPIEVRAAGEPAALSRPNTLYEGRTRISTVLASRVEGSPVDWLWPERIAIGALTVLAGDPGMGKSLITMDIAARVTRGTPWPDGTPCRRGSVFLISAEDAPDTTIAPRLAAAGADLAKVHIVDRVFTLRPGDNEHPRVLSLAKDLAALHDKIEGLGDVRLAVVDPISAYLSGVETHRNANVRAALAPLAEMARAAGVAILAVTHLNKGAGGKAIYRLTGSLAFVAAARAVYLVPEEGEAGAPGTTPASRRLFLQVKNNLGKHPNGSGHAFGIQCDPLPAPQPGGSTLLAAHAGPVPRIAWEGDPVAVDLRAIFDGERARAFGGKLGEAMSWLARVLAPQPVAAAAVIAGANGAGIPLRTLERAARALGVAKLKNGYEAGWLWSLAPKAANAHDENLAAFEGN